MFREPNENGIILASNAKVWRRTFEILPNVMQ